MHYISQIITQEETNRLQIIITTIGRSLELVSVVIDILTSCTFQGIQLDFSNVVTEPDDGYVRALA